jgi:hypothetical protein
VTPAISCYRLLMGHGRWRASGIAIVATGVMAAAGCGDVNAALAQLVQAQQVSSDLLVQFTKAADAANRAVMADTDEASVTFAHEADQAKQALHKDIDTLGPILHALSYSEETGILQEFVKRFADYDTLDKRILDLAVENTNLKAQQLSFGPAQDAADAFRDELDPFPNSVSARDTWRVRAVVTAAVAAVREIQVLQAPHIAAADDAVMARLEKRMAGAEATARSGLATLATMVPKASRTQLAAATAALDKFMGLNAQILALSHRNTNVRSLALSLSQKPALAAACEDRLHALNDALNKRGYKVARWK